MLQLDWLFGYRIANGQLVLDVYQWWLIVGTVTFMLAVGQQFGLTQKLQAAIVAVIIDAFAMQHLMTIQLMLELKLIMTLVADINAAILAMQVIVQEDLAGEDVAAFVAIEPAHLPVLHVVVLH